MESLAGGSGVEFASQPSQSSEIVYTPLSWVHYSVVPQTKHVL